MRRCGDRIIPHSHRTSAPAKQRAHFCRHFQKMAGRRLKGTTSQFQLVAGRFEKKTRDVKKAPNRVWKTSKPTSIQVDFRKMLAAATAKNSAEATMGVNTDGGFTGFAERKSSPSPSIEGESRRRRCQTQAKTAKEAEDPLLSKCGKIAVPSRRSSFSTQSRIEL